MMPSLANRDMSTLETQNLIYKMRMKRLQITRGLTRGERIDRVNAQREKYGKRTGTKEPEPKTK